MAEEKKNDNNTEQEELKQAETKPEENQAGSSDEPSAKTESDKSPQTKTDKEKLPPLKAGMTIKVHEKIKDIDAKGKERTRIQVFEGTILAVKKPNTPSGTILVRKISANNVGVEKIFPIHSPLVDKIEIVKQIKARRAKMYFLRDYKKRLKSKTTA